MTKIWPTYLLAPHLSSFSCKQSITKSGLHYLGDIACTKQTVSLGTSILECQALAHHDAHFPATTSSKFTQAWCTVPIDEWDPNLSCGCL